MRKSPDSTRQRELLSSLLGAGLVVRSIAAGGAKIADRLGVRVITETGTESYRLRTSKTTARRKRAS